MKTFTRILRPLALLALVSAPAGVHAQGLPIEASTVSPTVMVVLDTSGGMEFLPFQPTGPDVCACVSPYDDVCDIPHREPKMTPENTFDAGYYAGTRTRFHQALEVIGGTIENFYCKWDFRNVDRPSEAPRRVDQVDNSRPQGFPHAMACSYRTRQPEESDEDYFNRSCGPNIIQRDNGLLQNNRELARFGIATLDSFPEPGSDVSGMYSYGCDPADQDIPSLGDQLCLGIRRAGESVEGGLVVPNPNVSNNVGAMLTSLRYVVPYWSTPLAAALHDVRWMYQNENAFRMDTFGQCRDHNVVLVTDGLDNFDICTEQPSFPGCQLYWYPALVDGPANVAQRLYEETVAAGQEGQDPRFVNIYTVGYALDAFEAERSRLEDLWTFNDTGVPGIPESYLQLYADNAAQLQLQLSSVLSSVLQDHVVTRTPPVITTRTSGFVGSNPDDAVSRSRFEGRTLIRDGRPFWSGTILRIDTVCREDMSGNRTLFDLDESQAVDFAKRLEEDIAEAGDDPFEVRRVITTAGMQASHPALPPASSPFENTPEIPQDLTAELTNDEIEASCLVPDGNTWVCSTLLGNILNWPASPYPSQAPSMGWYGFYSMADQVEDPPVFGRYPNSAEALALFSLPPGEVASTTVRELTRWVWGLNLEQIRDWSSDEDAPRFVDVGPDFDYERQDRRSVIGDMLYSAPRFVPPPSSGVPFPGYDQFLDLPIEAGDTPRKVWQRPAMLYVGSNMGMLHGFDASTGEELWAYIPSLMHRSLIETARGRRAMVDGSPIVRDMRVFRGLSIDENGDDVTVDRWRTVLVGGLRSGGRGYFALDVTNPYEPKFLWELDHRKDPRLGLTYGEPALATIYLDNCHDVLGGSERHVDLPEFTPSGGDAGCERAVAILPGGQPPEPVGDFPNVGRVVYVVDVITGQVLRRFTRVETEDGTPLTTCNQTAERCLQPGVSYASCHPDLPLPPCGAGSVCEGAQTIEPDPVAGPNCMLVGAVSNQQVQAVIQTLGYFYDWMGAGRVMLLNPATNPNIPPNEVLMELNDLQGGNPANLRSFQLCMPKEQQPETGYIYGTMPSELCVNEAFYIPNSAISGEFRGDTTPAGERTYWYLPHHVWPLRLAVPSWQSSTGIITTFLQSVSQPILTNAVVQRIMDRCGVDNPVDGQMCSCTFTFGENRCLSLSGFGELLPNSSAGSCALLGAGQITRHVHVRGLAIDNSWLTPAGMGCSTGCDMTTSLEEGLCVPENAVQCSTNADCPPAGTGFIDIPSAISGSAVAFDVTAGGRATRAFMGDASGRMLRLDMSSGDPTDWVVDLFFDPLSLEDYPGVSQKLATNPRPVRFRPVIAYRQANAAEAENLTGSGKAVIIYGMGDTDSLETANDANFVFSLTESPEFDEDGLLVRTASEVNWIVEMEPGEKMTTRPRIYNRTAYFATYVPNEDPCEVGNPRLYGIDYVGRVGVEGLTRYLQIANLASNEMEDNAEHVVIGRLPDPLGPAAEVRGDFYFWDPVEGNLAVIERSVITSVDFVQTPACLLLDEAQSEQEYGAERSSSTFGQVEMVITSSAAGSTGGDTSGGGASSVQSSGVALPQPDGRVVPTSWGTTLPW